MTNGNHGGSRGPLRKIGCRGGLFVLRRGDGPLIIGEDKDHGRLEHAGEVGRFVEIALRVRPVTEINRRHPGLAAQAHPPREPESMGHLGCERDLLRKDPNFGGVGRTGTTQSVVGSSAATEPTTTASWPSMGALVPTLPWRCRAKKRGEWRRARIIWTSN